MMFRRKSRSQSAPEGGIMGAQDAAPLYPQRARSMMKLPRSTSLPSSLHGYRVKGIMKFCTVDDSLHSKYGESKDGSDSSSKGGDRGRIQFKDLLIREYARTVGDNPSCSSGPPISIAWDYDPETKIIAIDRYEDLRPPRRNHFEMILPREVRQQMLRSEWDVSQAQIASAVRNNIKVKNQRRATVNNLGKAEKMEEFFESAGSKIKKGIMLKKSTTRQALELDAMFENANRIRNQARVESMTADMEEEDDQSAFPPRQPQRRPSKVTAEEPSEDSAVGLDISGDGDGGSPLENQGAGPLSPMYSPESKDVPPPLIRFSGFDENLKNENPAKDDSDECNISI